MVTLVVIITPKCSVWAVMVECLTEWISWRYFLIHTVGGMAS